MASRKIPVVTDEIATVEKDITLGYIGRTILNPDKVIQAEGGQKGIEIFEDLLREDRVASELQKRKLAVIGKEWEIIPASDKRADQKVADFVEEVFRGFSYDTARQALLSGIVTGFKPGEVMWEYSEGDVWIKEIRGRSPKRFVFDLGYNLRLLTWSNMIEGEELPDRKFIVFRNPSDNASPYGDGLGRSLYWPVWFKKNGVKFWAVFLERFGQPTPWGKYPSGTAKDKQDLLLDCLKTMQTDNCIITPDNMSIELLEAARTSSVDSYARWEDFWNDAITILLLGQTATTTGTPGALGAQTEREAVRLEYVKADADLLSECQNDFLIPWLVDYNFPGITAYPKVWVRTEEEQDLKPLADRDRVLSKDIGVPMTKTYFYETYGIPEPEPDEELVSVPAPPAPFGGGPAPRGVQGEGMQGQGQQGFAAKAAISMAEAGLGLEKKNQKEIDRLIDKSLKDGGLQKFHASLMKIVNEATSYEDLQGRLLERFKDLDLETMKEIMGKAFVIANLKGRFDASGG